MRVSLAARIVSSVAATVALAACGSDDPGLQLEVVTFNTGTTSGLGHDDGPDDGYTSADADVSDMYYGDGLAWSAFIDDARAFFDRERPDIVVFQEIFHPGDCAQIPQDAWPGFVCESWTDGNPTVAQMVLGPDYQVACNLGKPDKCAAVNKSVGQLRGCDGDLCLDGLEGATVDGCGSGSRVGRGIIDLAAGGSVTLVNVHGSSGLSSSDIECRVRQFEQAFVDLGDGAPGANGAINVVMGDLNTDPVRFAGTDASATRFLDFVGDGLDFHFVTDDGPGSTPTYQGIVNIDHVVSDGFKGECGAAGITPGTTPVTEAVYFDHVPVVCNLSGSLPNAD